MNRKVYVVKFSTSGNEQEPMKVLASLMKAKCWCEDKSRKLFFPNNAIEPEMYEAYWEDNWTYRVLVGPEDGKRKEYCYEIEETSLDEDISPVYRPEVEEENEALRKENLELKAKLSEQTAMNAAAKCYLTMWDGGWKCTKEHIIENMHAARKILEQNTEGKAELEKMFEHWKENSKT